jgi:hypothetical protein
MLTKAGVEKVAQMVGASHEDTRFKSLLNSLRSKGQPRIRFCPDGHAIDPGLSSHD